MNAGMPLTLLWGIDAKADLLGFGFALVMLPGVDSGVNEAAKKKHETN